MEENQKNKPKIALISTDWGQNSYRKEHNKPGAISQYRLVNPMRYLEEFYDITYWGSDFAAAKAKNPERYFHDFMDDYDLVISKIIDNPQAAAMMRFFSQYRGTKLVVDIDDNIWELTPDQPGYEFYHKGSGKLSIASTFVSLADAVFSSTEPLAEYVKTRVKNVFKEDKDTYVLPNCVDTDDFQFEPVSKDQNKIIIGWQGSTTHHEDLRVAMDGMKKCLEKYPNVYFQFLGGMTEEMVKDLFKDVPEEYLDRVSIHGGVPAWDGFPHLLSEQQWDIAIAPLQNKLFNHAKSHIKWMEYAMYAIPCVASTVYPYYMPVQGTNTIEDGTTGLLAGDDEWFEKLSFLIENKNERIKIGQNAKDYVSEEWHMKKHAYKWKEAIDAVLAKEE